jgi:hypothetical protein
VRTDVPILEKEKEIQMVKTGTASERDRNEPVQPETRPIESFRGHGERAVLVSERHAVWDRRADALPAAADPVYDLGPFGPMPTEWTADLVHCRLLYVNALARRLPRARVPAGYRSYLSELQPQEAARAPLKALSSEEEKRLDATLAQLQAFGSIDKAVLMGMMAGCKPATISKVTFGIAAREGGSGIKRPTVYKRYQRSLQAIAEEWNRLSVSIDDGTRTCWLNEASRKA